jgi:hypothetical protein
MNMVLVFLLIVGSMTERLPYGLQIESISQSQIEGNVPDEKDFDRFLQRDLKAYYKEYAGKIPTVNYELLRKVPTQVGVANPKFYIWVRFYENRKLVEEGAMRIAAREKKHFDVVQYFTTEEIKQDPERVKKVFPQAVAEVIIQRAGQQK